MSVQSRKVTCCDRGRAEIIDYGTYPEGLLWVLRADTSKLLFDCPFCKARLPDDDDRIEVAGVAPPTSPPTR